MWTPASRTGALGPHAGHPQLHPTPFPDICWGGVERLARLGPTPAPGAGPGWPAWSPCPAQLRSATECQAPGGAGPAPRRRRSLPPAQGSPTLRGLHLRAPRQAPVGQSRLPCDLGPSGWVQDGLGRTSRDSKGERKSGAQEAGQSWTLVPGRCVLPVWTLAAASLPPVLPSPRGRPGHCGWPGGNAVRGERHRDPPAGLRRGLDGIPCPLTPAPRPGSAAPSGRWWPVFGPCLGCLCGSFVQGKRRGIQLVHAGGWGC